MTASAQHRSDSSVRDTARVAVAAALIVALTLAPGIYLFGGAVPVTLQTLGVALVATMLGPWRASCAVLVYLALIAVGLPVASGFRGGLGVFAGPSGGFLVGFVPMALVVGAVAGICVRRLHGVWLTLGLFAAAVAGLPVLYAAGVPWMAEVTGLPLAGALQASLVFLPGDVLKAAVAAAVTAGVVRAVPSLPGPRA